MSKLNELSNRVALLKAVQWTELRLHPDAKSFNMKFPIIMKDARKLFGDPSSNALEILNSDLIKIIKKCGDVQNRRTNVKADMTDWFMQPTQLWGAGVKIEAGKYQEFNSVGDIAIKLAQEASPFEVQFELYDIWGVNYTRGNFTKLHDHWPHPWSFSYYVKSDGTTPIIFPEAPQHFYPKTNDIIVWPGILRHSVPAHKSNEERIVISGNLIIKYS